MNLPAGGRAPLYLSWHQRVQPRFRADLSNSDKLVKNIPHRSTQKLRFQLIADAVKLTAKAQNHNMHTEGRALARLTSCACPSYPEKGVEGPTWACTRADSLGAHKCQACLSPITKRTCE